jgi:hypothetical protein
MKHTIIGIIGIMFCLSVFLLAVFMKDKIDGLLVLIFPLSLVLAYFFVGITTEGTIKGGAKKAFAFILTLVVAMFVGLLLRFLKKI